MSRIDDLIQELCPDGVEYRALKELFDTRGGYTPSKKNSEYWQNGTVPWFRMDDIRAQGRVLKTASQYTNESVVKKPDCFPLVQSLSPQAQRLASAPFSLLSKAEKLKETKTCKRN